MKVKSKLIFLISPLVVLLNLLWFISNGFLVVYVLLAIFSILVIMTSLFVARMIWGSKIHYDYEDIIYKSNSFENIKEAENQLNKKLLFYNVSDSSATKGEVFEEDKTFILKYMLIKKLF